MKDWIKQVKTTSVSEGPAGTLSRTRSPEEMANAILEANPNKDTGAILRYMQYVINRSGSNMSEEQRTKIVRAMKLVKIKRGFK